ncbi:MAG: TRAP transporter large permease subunit [Dehalococcoidales bacterium]
MSFLTKWADGIERVVRPISLIGVGISMVSLFIMVILLVASVIGRYAFLSPIPGIKELEEFLLILVAFLGLAYTGLRKGHVRVDIIIGNLPTWVQHVVDTVTGLMSLTLWVLMAWKSFFWMMRILGPPALTSEILGIPKAIFASIMIFGMIVFCFVLIAQIFRSIDGAIAESKKKALLILPALAFIGSIAVVPLYMDLPVSKNILGLIGVGFLVFLLLLRMPIGFAMGFVGFVGAGYIVGVDAGISSLEIAPYTTVENFFLVVLPLFFLMGSFCFAAKISSDLYDTCYTWLGNLPGGLASATIGGCAGFAAICGDSLATAAAMGRVALPEMRRYKYADSLSCGSIAAGGTLGILIPPSMGFIFYALITEQSIGKLFLAGLIPGILLASLFIISITIHSKLSPTIGPAGPVTTLKQKIISLRGTWAVIALFLLVVGGLYMGIFTVIEAGAVGAFGALLLMVVKGRANRRTVTEALLDTGRTMPMIIAILIGVSVLGYFLAISQLPLKISAAVAGLDVHRYVILALILFFYIIVGCLMNIIPMILLTLPIFWPTIVALGFDPIWFGVIMVIVMEMGQITPPVGMNVFVIAGIAETVPLLTIFKGIVPFFLIEILIIIILVLFPQIALWLPNTI